MRPERDRRIDQAVGARGAEVRFADRVLWRDVDLDIAHGTFTAILGPNGAGKSTLLKAILGLQPLSDGWIQVLGSPAGQELPRIGYVPQRKSFNRTLRLRGIDVVRLGLEGPRWGVPMPGPRSRHARTEVTEAVKLVGAEVVIPCHYNTFPPVETDVQAFKSDVETQTSSKVVVLEPGETHSP